MKTQKIYKNSGNLSTHFKTKGVICLGEAVINLFAFPEGSSVKDAPTFAREPGGAPANVAVALARLGVPTGFIGKAGREPFGESLLELFQVEGVDTTYFELVPNGFTSLAFVSSPTSEKQDFTLFPGADELLRLEDINPAYLSSAKVLAYGSVTLGGNAREAALYAAKKASQMGVEVAFDANLRPVLWKNKQVARDGIMAGVRTATICKMNITELELLTNTNDVFTGSRQILQQGPKLCLITDGRNGAYFNNGRHEGWVNAYLVKTVDTTGCGDAFLAGFLAGTLDSKHPVQELSEAGLRRIVSFANACAGLTATARGAIRPLPTRLAVDAFLEKHKSSKTLKPNR
jgi:fructokinase